MPRRTPNRLIAILFAGAACAGAHGAELGDVRVASHIGQPLAADIELIMVEDADQPVGVRLADPEVYRGAGITLPSVLASTHFAVVRRDGRQFVRVTSPRPVDAGHLHLYLELVDRGQRSVRLATLWLTPDPAPAPAAPAPAPVPEPEPIPLPPPPAPVVAPAPRHAAEPAACARQAEAVQACAALGEKNAALRAQLGHLEGRVNGLQATLGGTPVPALSAAAPAAPPEAVPEPAPAAPKPISAIKPLVPRKHAAPPPDDGLPWGWIAAAAAALAAAGAGVVFAVRRRARPAPTPMPAAAEQVPAAEPAPPGVLARIKAGLAARFRKRQVGEAVPSVEPILEQDRV